MYFRVKHFEKYVGAFLLFSIIVLVAVLVFIGRGQRWFEKKYSFITIFDSAGGVEPGAKVVLSGMEIGSVKDIRLSKDNKVEIVLSILDTYRDRIRGDSVARISGPIIGSKVIEISVGAVSQQPMLYEGGVIKSEKTKEVTDIIKEIDFKSPIDKLTEALDNVKSITEKFNRESGGIAVSLRETTQKINNSVGQITGNAGRITHNLDKTTGEIIESTRSLTKTLGNLETITGEIKEGKGNLGAAIKERGLYDNLLEATESLKKTTTNFEKASSDISGIVNDIKKSTSNVPGIVNTGQETMEDAHKLIQSVNKTWPISRNIKEPEPGKSISIDNREQPYK
ncbi:MAG: MCE family protein [Deltaproteobacteria bacterium]|jgi:phospholipid/cholesterol/gamma-HCH transport system substrate-binding protein|nr:MAG: MCE family protein [Deltaproteobacteria bacterium]